MGVASGEAFLKSASALALALALLAAPAGAPAHALEADRGGARAQSASDFAALAQGAKLPLLPSLQDGGAAPPAPDNPLVDAPASEAGPVAPTPDAAPTPTAEAPPAPELAPLNAAVKAALDARAQSDEAHPVSAERRRQRDAIAAFYAARGFAPLWSHDGIPNPEVESTLQRLKRAGEDGLDLKGLPIGYSADGAPDALAAADIALSDAVVAYGREASGSRIDPRTISPLIGARPTVAEPSAILSTVSAAGEGAGRGAAKFQPAAERLSGPAGEADRGSRRPCAGRRTGPSFRRVRP